MGILQPRLGQSLTAIAKLAPDTAMGEALSIHYSGGSGLFSDVNDFMADLLSI
jgi:sulfatase modifying factor 1